MRFSHELFGFFEPFITWGRNTFDYYSYCLRAKPWWFRLILLFNMVYWPANLSSTVQGLVSEIVDTHWAGGILLAVSVFLIGKDTLKDLRDSMLRDAVEEEPDPGAYRDVLPPDPSWRRWLLQVNGQEEPVFFNDALNRTLRSGRPIPLKRDQRYEKSLDRIIRDEERWETVFSRFLRHNHRKSAYKRKHFYNEKKYGLSADLDPERPVGLVHKTCYYDAYLLNIIPGKRLISDQTMECEVEAGEDLLCYRRTAEGNVLRKTGEPKTANEVGVSTLCILPNGTIPLWRQNRMAQCSAFLLVASGSGSADWKDCRSWFGHPDGLRKAVAQGMERELWEESIGKRSISQKEFRAQLDTRITGFFRWLRKNGIAEFVGITRMKDPYMVEALFPERSEVTKGNALQAHTVEELLQDLERFIPRTIDGDGPVIAKNCNVSCAMSLLALQEVCGDYCRSECPERGRCRRMDPSAGAEGACRQKPIEVLFPPQGG